MVLPPEVWAIVVYAGQLLDVLTTRIALTKFGDKFQEGNPIARFLLSRYDYKGLQVLKSVVAGGVLAAIGFVAANEWVWLALAVVSWFPVVWNALAIARAGSAA